MKNGIVIPCYNEAKRLHLDSFQQFADQNPEYILCFVNDGSRDETLTVLQAFQAKNAAQVEVFDMPQNGGKAEAVRRGVLHLLEQHSLSTVGFMDADLSTGFSDYQDLVQTITHTEGNKQLVFGSRKIEEDNHIERTFFRSLASKAVGLLIRSVLRLPIHDTQCGAKVFSAPLARLAFQSSFVTRWLFDVELFIRARKYFGRKAIMEKIAEQPLKQWVHVEGSKITLQDSLQIPGQLWRIFFTYEVQPTLNATSTVVGSWSYRLMTNLNIF
ncbi:MAG: glycosyltransferase family 2 protein [Lewinellaceae bacterium]|nr:glycosyltransferase family 2 protein [Lewinellaceae bacterium]